jgi:ATP-dependent helicase HrpB
MKTPLPIDAVLPEILAAVRSHGRVVLQAPPGAGKTTRVAPALLDVAQGDVIVLEPRRLAARLAARRGAEERGERVGDTVGYEVRFEREVGPRTRLQFVTEGILVRRLMGDPGLRGVGAIVLDEFHERHLQGDLVLALAARLRAISRPDLKILVMSATLDAAPVARYLGDAPIVTSLGKQFDVAIDHAPAADDRPLESRVASAVRDLIVKKTPGDILVFLPGAAEIRRAMDRCQRLAEEADLLLVPLHGDLPLAAQDRALRPAVKRKVIFSTNVAETSVTIEGVAAVVDSGLARVARHDPWSGRSVLEVAKISRSSATQRAGRAGRLGPGCAVRLYTRGDHDARPDHDAPEIERADLSEMVMLLGAIGVGEPAQLAWLTPPPGGSVEGACQLLGRLGAIGEGGRLTDLGRRMLRLPLPPRLARLVVEAEAHGAADEGCLVAAILAEGRDVYARSWDDRPRESAADEASDLVVRMYDVIDAGDDKGRARSAGLDAHVVASVDRARRQIARLCDRASADVPREPVETILRKAILRAYPDRVARRRADPAAGSRLGASRDLVMCTGGTANLADSSVVRTAQWLVAVESGDVGGRIKTADGRRGARVWLASAIEPEWLFDLGPGAVTETVDVEWNASQERVDAVERLMYDRLAIDERPAGPAGEKKAAALLAEKAIAAGLRTFVDPEDLDRLSARIKLVVETAPDLAAAAGIRPLDDAALGAILASRLAGKRSFAELRDGSLMDDIRAALGRGAIARLAELVPDQIAISPKRRVTVSYAPGEPPSIASRLQDFFGRSDTPRIVAGRCPVVLHLLAPNGRDVQVTSDLGGFWERTYPGVRSELMRRYPRHAWPVDPLTARPPEPKPRRG